MSEALTTPPSQMDPAWKTLLEVYFPQLMAFFWPQLAKQIDWEKGFESLDSELQAISQQAAIGKRLVDKLFQVYSKQGDPLRVLTHVEIQAKRQAHFEQRMFNYYCRIHLLKDIPLMTLVLLVDDDLHWRPQSYEIRIWNQPVIRFDFQAVKILDYRGRETELDRDPNPFAAVVLAQLAALETKNDPQRRFNIKWDLTRRLYKKGFTAAQIQHLYLFIDWVLTLPEELEERYTQEVEKFEKAQKMEFITGMERRGIEKGLQKGIQKGFQQGERAALLTLLKVQFPTISPETYEKELNQPHVSTDTLLKWIEKAAKAKTLDDVFGEEKH